MGSPDDTYRLNDAMSVELWHNFAYHNYQNFLLWIKLLVFQIWIGFARSGETY